MRGTFSWIAAGCLLLAECAAVHAQTAPPSPPPLEKVPEAAKAPELKKVVERDGGSQTISYTLAAIGTIIVMVLVCMPARRE